MSDNARYINLGLPSESRVRALSRTFGAVLRRYVLTAIVLSTRDGLDKLSEAATRCELPRKITLQVGSPLHTLSYPPQTPTNQLIHSNPPNPSTTPLPPHKTTTVPPPPLSSFRTPLAALPPLHPPPPCPRSLPSPAPTNPPPATPPWTKSP